MDNLYAAIMTVELVAIVMVVWWGRGHMHNRIALSKKDGTDDRLRVEAMTQRDEATKEIQRLVKQATDRQTQLEAETERRQRAEAVEEQLQNDNARMEQRAHNAEESAEKVHVEKARLATNLRETAARYEQVVSESRRLKTALDEKADAETRLKKLLADFELATWRLENAREAMQEAMGTLREGLRSSCGTAYPPDKENATAEEVAQANKTTRTATPE